MLILQFHNFSSIFLLTLFHTVEVWNAVGKRFTATNYNMQVISLRDTILINLFVFFQVSAYLVLQFGECTLYFLDVSFKLAKS